MKDILSNPRVLQLSPMAFKAYFYLRDKADKNGVIKKFSIRGQAKEWDIDNNMNLTNNKITMKKILVELEEKELVQYNSKEKKLEFLSLNNKYESFGKEYLKIIKNSKLQSDHESDQSLINEGIYLYTILKNKLGKEPTKEEFKQSCLRISQEATDLKKNRE